MSPREALIAAMQVTAAAALKPVPVKTKQWGTVYVKAVSVAEVEEQVNEVPVEGKKRSIARGAARVLCDADGTRMFDPDNAEHIELLAAQPWPLLQKVLSAGDKFNATSEEGVEAAKNG